MNQQSLFDDGPVQSESVSEEIPQPAVSFEATPVAPAPQRAPSLTAEERERQMTALRDQAVVCTRCPLSNGRTQVVFGEGEIHTPLVFVGEGPGETEDATGRPFVGRAGKLLDEALRLNGMKREHVYICNVVKCRPTKMENGRLWNRQPTTEEIAACRDWLDQQLRIIQPLVIVCLGSPAANSLIHSNFAITRERGKWFNTSPYAPWIMAALHPAFVLRQHGAAGDTARDSLIQDIGAARLKVVDLRKAARSG